MIDLSYCVNAGFAGCEIVMPGVDDGSAISLNNLRCIKCAKTHVKVISTNLIHLVHANTANLDSELPRGIERNSFECVA